MGGPSRQKRTVSANELLHKEPRLRQYSRLKRERRLGHTRAVAPSLVEVPLPLFWHTDTMAPNRRVPTWPGAPRGSFRSGDGRTQCTKDGRQLLGWVGLPTLSAHFFVAGATDAEETEVETGRLSQIHLHFE